MPESLIALFGEAEKGDFYTPTFCESLHQLEDSFGNPPQGTLGLHYAVQALFFHHPLLYFRVKEEGFSLVDYLMGIKKLKSSPLISAITAIAVPGTSDKEIMDALTPILLNYKTILISSEADLYDYLTS